MRVLLGAVVALLLTGSASADTVWNYAGNTMNGYVFSDQSFSATNCNCALDGTVTLDASNQAIAWSFTDGTHTLTNLNSTGVVNPFELSSTPFSTWFLTVHGAGIQFWSQFTGSDGEATDYSVANNAQFGYEEGNHGVWTEESTTKTAEPATGLLVGAGLVVVSLLRRKKKPTHSTTWENLG